MQRHEGDGIRIGVVVIHIGQQRQPFHESLQCKSLLGVIRLLLLFGDDGLEFQQVFDAGVRFDGIRVLQRLQVTGAGQHRVVDLLHAHALLFERQRREHLRKGLNSRLALGGQAALHLRIGQGLQQAAAGGGRHGPQLFLGLGADAAFGLVEHAQQCHVVQRIEDEPHIRQHVLDLLAVVVAQAGQHLVGNALAGQAVFETPRLHIRAVQDGKIRVFQVRVVAHERADLLAGPAGFFAVVGSAVVFDLLTCRCLGPQFFRLAAPVAGDDAVGGLDDVGGGAVVLLQFDDLRPGEIFFKFQDVADVRAAPLVDALVVVAHHAQVAVLLRQQIDQSVLQHVGVLVLVHHDVFKLLLILQQRLFVALKQPHRIEDEVVEVHGVVLF